MYKLDRNLLRWRLCDADTVCHALEPLMAVVWFRIAHATLKINNRQLFRRRELHCVSKKFPPLNSLFKQFKKLSTFKISQSTSLKIFIHQANMVEQ